MPFAIWVTRATTGAEARQARPHDAPPMDMERLRAVLTRLGAMFHPQDGAWWVRDPKTREAWCILRCGPSDEPLLRVELSTSYSNPHFMRNMLDMFDLALMVARNLDARVFEETHGTEITASNVDTFLARDGTLVKEQHAFFRSGREDFLTSMRAHLEFPLGVVDEVPDYFQFTIKTEEPAPSLGELCADTPSHLSVHLLGQSAILDLRERKLPAVRIIRLEDGVLVRPYWSSLPFVDLARETLRTVDRLERRFGKETRYLQQPCTAEQRAELERHAQGLGVEYYDWLVAQGPR